MRATQDRSRAQEWRPQNRNPRSMAKRRPPEQARGRQEARMPTAVKQTGGHKTPAAAATGGRACAVQTPVPVPQSGLANVGEVFPDVCPWGSRRLEFRAHVCPKRRRVRGHRDEGLLGRAPRSGGSGTEANVAGDAELSLFDLGSGTPEIHSRAVGDTWGTAFHTIWRDFAPNLARNRDLASLRREITILG